MTKRRLAREIDEMSEDVLGDLDPDDRVQLFFEASAADKEEWLERLRQTAPIHTYRAIGPGYRYRRRIAWKFLVQALYDLHTMTLQYALLDLRQRTRIILDITQETEPSEDVRARAEERADEIKHLFIELYTVYHAYQQFAPAAVGVDLETWFRCHSDGPAILDVVETVLDDELRYARAEEFLNAEFDEQVREIAGVDVADEFPWITLDELADQRFQDYVELWEEMLIEIP